MNRISWWINAISAAILISLLSVTACQKKQVFPEVTDTNEISLKVSEGKAFVPDTKSTDCNSCSEPHKELLLSDNEFGDLFLEMTEDVIQNDSAEPSETETKGAPYEGKNIGSFTVVSYVDGKTDPYFSKSYTSDGSSVITTGYYWPLQDKLDFFAYAKSNGNGTLTVPVINPAEHSGSFTYTLPDPTGDSTSAVEQPDLAFAVSANQTNDGNAVSLTFYHALSSVVFSTKNVPSQFKVESITFTNILSKADCSYSLTGTDLTFEWTGASTKKTFTQTYEEEVGGASGNPINTTEESFMMIPQTIGNDAKIIVTVSFQEREYTIEKDLRLFTTSWKPGMRYTFRISSPEEVQLDISENFTEYSSVKRDVFFTNTGLSTIKVRAAMVGYWVVKATINGEEQECIIADWDPENDGTFVGLPGTGWTKNADGYYYFTNNLAPSENTNNLFDSYTLKGSPPVIGAELILTIIGQAVIDGYEDSTWNAI